MARAPTLVVQEDYIDMDLTPRVTPPPPSSPRCNLREFEFQSVLTSAKHKDAFAAPADELFYKGNLLPLHLPPRLQLVQKLLQEQQRQVQEKAPSNAAACAEDEEAGGEIRGSAKKYSWSKRLKLMKRWATSRDYFRSLFLAKPNDNGNGIDIGNSNETVLGQEELCHHRKSFSGIIRRVRLVTTRAPVAASPLCSSSSSSSSSSTPSCGNADGFFRAMPALKRSSSADSEEGAIQGAIAHCKRSQQQQQQQVLSARRSVSDVVFYSLSNTPKASVPTSEPSQEKKRQEMCRG